MRREVTVALASVDLAVVIISIELSMPAPGWVTWGVHSGFRRCKMAA